MCVCVSLFPFLYGHNRRQSRKQLRFESEEFIEGEEEEEEEEERRKKKKKETPIIVVSILNWLLVGDFGEEISVDWISQCVF